MRCGCISPARITGPAQTRKSPPLSRNTAPTSQPQPASRQSNQHNQTSAKSGINGRKDGKNGRNGRIRVPTMIKHPPLRYHGSKWRLAPWIISQFPAHRTYCEPFAGGAGVLLRKMPSEVEIYNDLDGRVVNFFRVARDHPAELMVQLLLTPYARAEAVACREPSANPVEDARRSCTASWQLFGGGQGQWHTGFPCPTRQLSQLHDDDLAAPPAPTAGRRSQAAPRPHREPGRPGMHPPLRQRYNALLP